jgi:hypothetical protein
MRLTDYFDQFLIVNLAERADRRALINAELAKVNLSIIPGKIDFFPAMRPEYAEGFPSRGARGCFLSHLTILEQARTAGMQAILIGEDDLVFSPRYLQDETSIVDQLRTQSWGFAYLGNAFNKINAEPVRMHAWSDGVLCTHFYAIHSSIFDPLIGFLHSILTRPPGHPDGGPMHLDGAYSTFRANHPEIPTLMALPTLGAQGSSASDITTSWWDNIPAVRSVVDVYRGMKRKVRGY